MTDQQSKAELFKALHERPGAFVIPNPWDAGTAILLAGLGFEALATTSAGLAFSLGRRDAGGITRAEAIGNVRAIAGATPLPVSADLENGYADDPAAAAQALIMAAEAGAVGGSIEDAAGNPSQPIYSFDHSVERVAAAAAFLPAGTRRCVPQPSGSGSLFLQAGARPCGWLSPSGDGPTPRAPVQPSACLCARQSEEGCVPSRPIPPDRARAECYVP